MLARVAGVWDQISDGHHLDLNSGPSLGMPELASNANFSPAWKPGEKIEELS
jgi:hypothetical protein